MSTYSIAEPSVTVVEDERVAASPQSTLGSEEGQVDESEVVVDLGQVELEVVGTGLNPKRKEVAKKVERSGLVVSDGAIGKAMWFSEVEDVMTSQTFDVAHVATWLQKGDVMQVDTRDVLVGSVSEEAVTHTLFTRLLEYYEGKLKVTERKERAAVREECDRMKQVLLEGGGTMHVVMSKMTEAGATPELLSSVFTFGSGPVLKRACVARVGPTVARASYRLSERGDDPGPTALQHTATQRLGLVKSDSRVHAKSATFVTPSDEKAWESWLRRPSAGRLHQFFNRLCIKAHT